MATYTTQADLESQYGTEQVLIASDRDASGVADTDVISGGIAAASEEIDSYLSVRFNLPLTTTPAVLLRVANILAMYHISADAGAQTEDKIDRYKMSLKWLDKLSKGQVDLGISEGQEVVPDIPTVNDEVQARIFTRTTMARLL